MWAEGTLDYSSFIGAVTRSFDKDNLIGAKLIGILFARPECELCKSQILPQLDYFHWRSGKRFDFYCVGYAKGSEFSPNATRHKPFDDGIFILRGEVIDDPFRELSSMLKNGTNRTIAINIAKQRCQESWTYSTKYFNHFRECLSKETTWKYSGEVDLILINAIRKSKTEKSRIDFSSAIVCHLDQMIRDQSITSVSTFFEKIMNYVDTYQGSDPSWGFSDSLGLRTSMSALKRLALEALPKNLGTDMNKATHFAVTDISKDIW